ncbi:MAG: hypothetical protein HQL73_10205 [Magnetococcales bacterium]|nr:hypothetical protein [Magnetococcales bacterium]
MELIMVIITLGILAAMALPRFGNITPSAADANAKAIAGALGVAAANYNTNCSVGVGSCTALTCASALALMSGITIADYTLGGSPAAGCTIKHASGSTTYTSAPILP